MPPSKSPTVPTGATQVKIDPSNVSTLLDVVAAAVDAFEERLDEPYPEYLNEWELFLVRSRKKLRKQAPGQRAPGWADTAPLLHSKPTTWHDYVAAVLEMVPPLRPVLQLQKPKAGTRQATIHRFDITDAIFSKQMDHHQKWSPSAADNSQTSARSSTPSSLVIQETEHTQWELSIEDLKSDMNNRYNELKELITSHVSSVDPKEFDKVRGDLKNYEEKVQTLRVTAESLMVKASDANDKIRKEYATATQEFTKLRDTTIEEVKNTCDDIKPQFTNVEAESQIQPSPYYSPYLKPNEYIVNNKKISIRGDLFISDPAPIKCESTVDILSTYSYIASIASQYGIIITPADLVKKWFDPHLSAFAPTFGLPEMDFASRELATQAYTSMSHSLATKLTTHVTFGNNFIAAKYIINEHEKDGFKMLYDLLALVHPTLAHDLAQGPKNPVFEGDLNKYMTQFTNFMDCEHMRGRNYDDDEIADYIISALKSSKWYVID